MAKKTDTVKEPVVVEERILNEIHTMLDRGTTPLSQEKLIEGPVIGIEKAAVYIDLGVYGTGVIYGREFRNAREIIKKMNIGDVVKAKIVETENDDGYVELSLKEAKQALIWNEAEKAIKEHMIFELPVKDANKGGLIIEWQGIAGFLPASQLKPDHYPRVEDSDKDKILKELKKLVGKKINVTIVSALPKDGKLIFSEKESSSDERQAVVGKYAMGDELETTVAGIVDFGVFLKVEEGLEGLVHISELDWGLVEDPRQLYKVGDKVKAKIIDIRDGKISLSIKALKNNPWNEFDGKLKKGDIIKGVVIKFNKHGALVSIKQGVAGLVHHSNFGSEAKLREKLELGKTYTFQVTLFDPKEQRMTLTWVEDAKK